MKKLTLVTLAAFVSVSALAAPVGEKFSGIGAGVKRQIVNKISSGV